MSDRRPENLYKCEITPTYDEAYDPPEFFGNVISYPEATFDEVLAFVRRGVESGTIKGAEVWLGTVDSGPALHTAVFWDEESAKWNEPRGPYVLIPVADGCDHEWVDATNAVVSSGEWCPKCNAVRGVSDEEDA